MLLAIEQFLIKRWNQTTKDLGDVVVISQRKADNGMVPINERNLTTAQVHINAKDLEEMQSASIDQALQGRLPGVDITCIIGRSREQVCKYASGVHLLLMELIIP